jgi:hypothetical protein
MESLRHPARDFALLPYALGTENPEIVDHACRTIVLKEGGLGADSDMGGLAMLMRDLLHGRNADWRGYIRRHHPDGRTAGNPPAVPVELPWIARLGGDRRLARKYLRENVKRLNAWPPRRRLQPLIMAAHCRSLLLLVSPREKSPLLAEARRQAAQFFRDRVHDGFNTFRPMLELAQ